MKIPLKCPRCETAGPDKTFLVEGKAYWAVDGNNQLAGSKIFSGPHWNLSSTMNCGRCMLTASTAVFAGQRDMMLGVMFDNRFQDLTLLQPLKTDHLKELFFLCKSEEGFSLYQTCKTAFHVRLDQEGVHYRNPKEGWYQLFIRLEGSDTFWLAEACPNKSSLKIRAETWQEHGSKVLRYIKDAEPYSNVGEFRKLLRKWEKKIGLPQWEVLEPTQHAVLKDALDSEIGVQRIWREAENKYLAGERICAGDFQGMLLRYGFMETLNKRMKDFFSMSLSHIDSSGQYCFDREDLSPAALKQALPGLCAGLAETIKSNI